MHLTARGQPLLIESQDVCKVLTKWDRHDPQQKTRWEVNDRLFYESFSSLRIDREVLKQFAALNDDRSKRTGGYSISRRFWGGIQKWTPLIAGFLCERVAPARKKYRQIGDRDIVFRLHNELAKMPGMSIRGNSGSLGTVPASKLLFFACPEMPFFIYDSFVGCTLGKPSIWVKHDEL